MKTNGKILNALSHTKIVYLAGIHDTYCISLYIPTHQTGPAVLQQADALVLKNQIFQIAKALKVQGLDEMEVKESVEPLEKLLEDTGFWRNQSQGLAIFLSKDVFEILKLPISLEAFVYVNTSFYLKPLITMLIADYNFFVLGLEANKVQLYEIKNNDISEIVINDVVPSTLEDIVGYDFKQNDLQFRSSQKGNKKGNIHGYAAGKDDKTAEIQKFYTVVNHGISQFLKTHNKPLVLAGLEYLCARYKNVNSYKGLFNTCLSSHPFQENIETLKIKASELIDVTNKKSLDNKLAVFKAHEYTNKTSVDKEAIIQAIFKNNVDTLFLEKGTQYWGTYNGEQEYLKPSDSHELPNVDLSNLVAVQLFLQGKNVYELKKTAMPASYSSWNALFCN